MYDISGEIIKMRTEKGHTDVDYHRRLAVVSCQNTRLLKRKYYQSGGPFTGKKTNKLGEA